MDVVGNVGVRVDVDVVRERRVGERAVGGRRGRHGGYRNGHEETDLVKKRGRRTSDSVTCARSGRGMRRKPYNIAIYQIQKLRQHRSVRTTPRAQPNVRAHERTRAHKRNALARTHERNKHTRAQSNHTTYIQRARLRERGGRGERNGWSWNQVMPFGFLRMLEGRTVK